MTRQRSTRSDGQRPGLNWEAQKSKNVSLSMCLSLSPEQSLNLWLGRRKLWKANGYKESKEMEKSLLEPRMVSTTAPRQTVICVYSSQHPLSSHFCQLQSKQATGSKHDAGNYVSSSLLSFLHVSSPSLSTLLIHGYWSGDYRRNTSHRLDQPCWTVTGFILGLYTWGNEVLIPLS